MNGLINLSRQLYEMKVTNENLVSKNKELEEIETFSSNMVTIYVNLIKRELKTLEDVPPHIKSEVEEVLKCIEMARKRRKTANPVIIHSDRGVHYTSKLYKKLTAGLILSYSKKGTPWDNACIESFHSVIKREWLNRTLIYDYDHAYDLCFEYIETFYNTIRIHSHCGYESPNQYENNYYSKH